MCYGVFAHERERRAVHAETEKAVQGHHDLLVTLHSRLRERGWTQIQEIPAAIDLWARDPDGNRVIFEAKTLAASELERLRSAAIHLLEYRYFYASSQDRLCIVTDRRSAIAKPAFSAHSRSP